LKGEAREWFNGLNPFNSFSAIKHQFLNRFSTKPKKKQHPASLFALKQGQAESLTNFVRRFNLELQIVDNPSDQIILSAMINGMKPEEPLLAELARGSTTCTLQQFTDRIEVYLRKEEAIRKLEKVAKPLYPPGRIRPKKNLPRRKERKLFAPKNETSFRTRSGLC
jgi:hypothetical protein